MDCETYTLAPSAVVNKARQLVATGLYAPERNRGFKKGNTIGRRRPQRLGESRP